MTKFDQISNKTKYLIEQLITRAESKISALRLKRVYFVLTLIVSFLLIYILNRLHPYFGDDWSYSMLPDGHTKISTFGQILQTQYEHYFTWGGRSVVHIIAQTLLLLGENIADLLNSFAYIAITLIIYNIANQSKECKPSLLIGINMMIWFFQPAFGSTILWITGSANYLWGTLIILSFLLPYVRYINNNPNNAQNHPQIRFITMLLFGIIAGWTNENMAIGLIFMLIMFVLYCKLAIRAIPTWAISGLIGAVIGAAIMIAAPGNYNRMDLVLANQSHQTAISIHISRFIASLTSYYYYALPATFVLFCLTFIYKDYRKDKSQTPMTIAIIFFTGALIATLAMSASPIFPGRASFGINTLLFVSISILFANLNTSTTLVKGLSYATLTFALLIFIADYKRSTDVLREVKSHYETRLSIINEGKKRGITDFVLNDRIDPVDKTLHYFELTRDSTNWHNRIYSGYYGLHSIIVK